MNEMQRPTAIPEGLDLFLDQVDERSVCSGAVAHKGVIVM
jgi:hypothetical protein